MELEIPRERYARRVFWLVVGGSLLVLVLLLVFVLPWLFGTRAPSAGQFLDSTFEEMIAVILGATVLSGAVLYFSAPAHAPTNLQVLNAHDINRALETNLAAAQMWWYCGSTGRYARGRVLPELAKKARADGDREVVLQILDPRDAHLCQIYADYRGSTRTGQDQDWTVAKVRRDIYATIVAAYGWKSAHPRLKVQVGLRRYTSTLRYDLSDVGLVVTQEDPKEPALSCPADSFYFRTYFADLKYSMEQAFTLADVDSPTLTALDVPSCRSLLEQLGFVTPELALDAEIALIIREARNESHPYA